MGTYFCIPKEEADKGLGIYKSFGQEDYKMFNIQLFPCQNSTSSSIICKPYEVIENALGGVYLSTFFLDSALNTNNYTNPYAKVIRNEFTTISISSFTNFNVFYKHLYLETDNGLLFKNVIEERIPKFDSSKSLISSKPGRDGLFVEFTIQLAATKVIYYRKYIKLQELMAQIGWIANLFLIIISCLNYYPSSSSFKAYIVNSFFDFPGKESTQMKNWQQVNKEAINLKGMNLQPRPLKDSQNHLQLLKDDSREAVNNNNRSVSKFTLQHSMVNSYQLEGDNIGMKAKHKERYSIKLSLSQSFFFACLPKKNFSKYMVNLGYEKVNSKLTIESLYGLFRAFMKLKYLLLSESENFMFDNVDNPFITGIEDKMSLYSEFSQYISEFNFTDSRKNKKLYSSNTDANLRKIDMLQQIFQSSL